MDRRAIFFLIASAASFLLVLVADPSERWVAIMVGVVYVVLAVGSVLDAWSRARRRP